MNRRELLRAGAALGMAGAGSPSVGSAAGWLADLDGRAAASPSLGGDVLLNSNENPLGRAPAAREAARAALMSAHRYPDASRESLADRLARSEGLRRENVVLGNGSTEILQMIVQAASSPNAPSFVCNSGVRMDSGGKRSWRCNFCSSSINA